MNTGSSQDSLEPFRRVGWSWGLVLLFGLVTLALGIVIAFRPGGTVRVLAIIFGIWLLGLGAFWIILAIAERSDTGGTRFGMVILGLLAVLIGLLVQHHPFETVAALGFLIGAFWVVGGLDLLSAGFGHEAEGRRTRLIVLGLVYAITGIVCLVVPGALPDHPGGHPRNRAHRLRGDRDTAGIPDPQGRRPLMVVWGTTAAGPRRVPKPGAR
jgi:uncharacterized membrane protein HdeD (DUF308 family)